MRTRSTADVSSSRIRRAALTDIKNVCKSSTDKSSSNSKSVKKSTDTNSRVSKTKEATRNVGKKSHSDSPRPRTTRLRLKSFTDIRHALDSDSSDSAQDIASLFLIRKSCERASKIENTIRKQHRKDTQDPGGGGSETEIVSASHSITKQNQTEVQEQASDVYEFISDSPARKRKRKPRGRGKRQQKPFSYDYSRRKVVNKAVENRSKFSDRIRVEATVRSTDTYVSDDCSSSSTCSVFDKLCKDKVLTRGTKKKDVLPKKPKVGQTEDVCNGMMDAGQYSSSDEQPVYISFVNNESSPHEICSTESSSLRGSAKRSSAPHFSAPLESDCEIEPKMCTPVSFDKIRGILEESMSVLPTSPAKNLEHNGMSVDGNNASVRASLVASTPSLTMEETPAMVRAIASEACQSTPVVSSDSSVNLSVKDEVDRCFGFGEDVDIISPVKGNASSATDYELSCVSEVDLDNSQPWRWTQRRPWATLPSRFADFPSTVQSFVPDTSRTAAKKKKRKQKKTTAFDLIATKKPKSKKRKSKRKIQSKKVSKKAAKEAEVDKANMGTRSPRGRNRSVLTTSEESRLEEWADSMNSYFEGVDSFEMTIE